MKKHFGILLLLVVVLLAITQARTLSGGGTIMIDRDDFSCLSDDQSHTVQELRLYDGTTLVWYYTGCSSYYCSASIASVAPGNYTAAANINGHGWIFDQVTVD